MVRNQMLYPLSQRIHSLTQLSEIDYITEAYLHDLPMQIYLNEGAVVLNKTRTVRGSDYSPAIELSEQKDKKLVTATGDTEKYSEKQANKVWLNSVYWFSRY